MSENWWTSVREKMAVVFSSIWDVLGSFVAIFLSKAGTVLAQSAIQPVKVVGGHSRAERGADSALRSARRDRSGEAAIIKSDLILFPEMCKVNHRRYWCRGRKGGGCYGDRDVDGL
jgi:hypothetical protein